MSVLDKLAHRLRGEGRAPEARKAARRSEEIAEHVERQEIEVLGHSIFARLVVAENHLAPKIRRAIREDR